jgi:ribosomal protein L7/L12
MEVTMKRISVAKPYVVGDGQIYSHYEVLVRWPDGKRQTFPSEEHAKAAIESRAVDQDAVQREVPAGYQEALAKQIQHNCPQPDVTVEESSEADVVLVSYGDKKISVVKAVREATGFGLKESKELAESCPVVVLEALDRDEAEALAQKLRDAGATVELK